MTTHRTHRVAALRTMVCGFALFLSSTAACAAEDATVQTRADAAAPPTSTETATPTGAPAEKTFAADGSDTCKSDNTDPTKSVHNMYADASPVKPYKFQTPTEFLSNFNFAGNANDIAISAVETCSYSALGLSSTNRADSKSPIGLNYSKDAIANNSTATYTFAVGYVIAPGGSNSVNIYTPFFGLDNESTDKPPASGGARTLKYTEKTAYGGLSYAHVFCIFDDKCVSAKRDRAAVATVVDAYYLNDQLLHAKEWVEDIHVFPVWKWVNKYDGCGIGELACAWLVNGQVTTGQYVDPGLNPALDRDYVRYGGRVGAVVRFPVSQNDSISVQGTYQDFWAGSGVRKGLGETNAQITFKPKDSLAGFALSYTDGRDVNTGLRVQTWKIGVTLTPQQ